MEKIENSLIDLVLKLEVLINDEKTYTFERKLYSFLLGYIIFYGAIYLWLDRFSKNYKYPGELFWTWVSWRDD